MKRLLPLLLGAALAATVSACGSDDSAAPDTTAPSSAGTAAQALPNPCDLPETTTAAADLVTTDRITSPVGTEFSGWKGCIWKTRAGWFDSGVYTGQPTVAEFQKDPRFGDYTPTAPTSVGGKQGSEFADRLDPDRRERCYIGVDMPYGMALFMARIPYVREGEQAPGDPCVEVRRISAGLVEGLG